MADAALPAAQRSLTEGPIDALAARGVERLQVTGLTELFALRLDHLDVEFDADLMRLES
jgi:hypothetical protein